MKIANRHSLRALALGVLAGAAILAAAPAQAEWRGPGWHNRGPTVIINGGGYWGPWYPWYWGWGYDPFFMGPPYYYERPRHELTPADAGLDKMPPPPMYWYYCDAAGAYYPYVSSCPAGWRPVPVTPPAPPAAPVSPAAH
jgi:hypothetical protein